MPYPPLIRFDLDTKERLRSYLTSEIDNHEAERSSWVEDLKRWEKLYWADSRNVNTSSKSPLQSGATIIVPLIAIAVEMLQAKVQQKLFGLDQFVALTLSDEWDDIDRDLEKLLDRELISVGNVKHLASVCGLDYLKYGTTVAKTGYLEYNRRSIRYEDETGTPFEFTVKGIRLDPVQLVNFLMPFSATDPNTSDWCGEFHTFTPREFEQLSESGFFYEEAYDKLYAYFNDLNTSGQSKSLDFLRTRESAENRIPVWPKRIHIYEIWTDFDVDGDGEKEAVCLFFHRDSGYICGARYNDRSDLSRPYEIASNFPVEGRWTGIGQCHMGEQFQIEITTQHRQRIDAAAISILRMFKAKVGSKISPDEPVFAGKIWMVEEMDELDIIQTGEIYPSAYQNEQSAIMFWQQRSTVNELTLGMPQVGTPGTAASELARVTEGNLRFDYTYSRFKDFIRKLCLDGVCLIGKHGVRHEMIFEQLPTGQRVKEFLSQPSLLLKYEIIFKFDLAGQSQNKLIDRATWTQLGGMLTQYYSNLMQLATQLGDKNLMQVISSKAMLGATEVMKQVFQSYEVRNIEKILLTPMELSGGTKPDPTTAIPGIAGILPTPGAGFVNPINTTPGG